MFHILLEFSDNVLVDVRMLFVSVFVMCRDHKLYVLSLRLCILCI